MPKNIVICCDECGFASSNVFKLFSSIQVDEPVQVAFYHPGISTDETASAATRIANAWMRLTRLYLGHGLVSDIGECYRFLMNNYWEGDRLFVFGVGRGACTARGLASILDTFGLVAHGNEGLVSHICRWFRHFNSFPLEKAAGFKRTFSRPCATHFIGVWDTVGCFGRTLDDPAARPAIGRHAVSIDEKRRLFRPRLWGHEVGSDLKEVWFAGVHADVGGGYPERESGLSKISLEWMLMEAERYGLLVRPERIGFVLGHPPPASAIEQLSGPYAELKTRIINQFWGTAPNPVAPMHKSSSLFASGSPRRIPEGSLIHESVFQRMRAVSTYRPSNLPQSYKVEDSERFQPLHGWSPEERPFEEVVENASSERAQSALAISELLSSKVLHQRVLVRYHDGSLKEFASVWDIPPEIANEITTDEVRVTIRG